MDYRLLLINPEGALYDSNGQLPENVITTVKEAQSKYGLKVALVTYNTLQELFPLSETLGLEENEGYLVCPPEEVVYICHTQRTIPLEGNNLVKFFMNKLDLLQDEIAAVGADEVDAEMIQTAGMGVAMAQASEPLKTCAQYVTLTCDEEGIVHFIDKYIRNNTSGIPYSIEEINSLLKNTLISRLGITATIVADGYVEMTMPVDNWTSQPLGILHGGANLALAETAAGLGSMVLADKGTVQVGIQVSGYHVGRALVGDTMRCEARILHKGKSTHVWGVEIYSIKSNKLIHTARVLNSIIKIR